MASPQGGGESIAKSYRINHLIRVREVRVIDENGVQLGVLPIRDALQLARERDLDLVEVAPTAEPPVCRVLDYGKFRYMQAKKDREARKGQKYTLLREVRFRPRIGDHDLAAKQRQIQKLLQEGSKVKVSVLFRGREITHPELGIALLRRVAEALKAEAKLERPPAHEGRMIGILLAPVAVTPQREQSPDTEETELRNAQAQDA